MKFSALLMAVVTSAATFVAAQDCTTTLTHFAKFDLSPTTTVYQTTVTDFAEVDCQGCALDIRTVGGPGPVRKITATATKEATTTTETVCAETGY